MSKASMLVKDRHHKLFGKRVDVSSFRRIGWHKQSKGNALLIPMSMVENHNNKSSKVAAMKDLTKRVRSRGPGIQMPKQQWGFTKTQLRREMKKNKITRAEAFRRLFATTWQGI